MENKQIAVIAVNGHLRYKNFVKKVCSDKFVIACDYAGFKLIKFGINPNIIIGDLDSSNEVLSQYERNKINVVSNQSQEVNDFEKALELSCDLGYKQVFVIGISGGQTDHILNNFSIVKKYSFRLDIILLDKLSVGYILNSENEILTLITNPNDRISLIPFCHAVVETNGLNWELRNEKLEFGVREGASNFAKNGNVFIKIKSGFLVAFHFAEKLKYKF